jgi:sugar lactone lactonase YvrE
VISIAIITGAVFVGYRANNEPYFFLNVIQPGPADIVFTFGGAGTGPGLFQDATGIAIDGKGMVYVSDNQARRIQRFNSDGQYLGGWPIESSNKYGTGLMAADRAGTVYVVWAGSILKYDGATGAALGTLNSHRTDFIPDLFNDVFVLPDGSIMTIGGAFGADLVRFAPDGTVLSRVERPIEQQTGDTESSVHGAVDGLGQIFLLGGWSYAVYHFSPDGHYVNRFGSQGDADDQFDQPVHDIAVDNQSRVYVSDWKGIQMFDPTGRYLGRIPKRGGLPYEMAFNDRNELFVTLGYGKQVMKLVVQSPQP